MVATGESGGWQRSVLRAARRLVRAATSQLRMDTKLALRAHVQRVRKELLGVRDRLLRRTSITHGSSYESFSARAAEDDSAFAVFKRSTAYTAVLEHVDYAAGAEYLSLALEREPALVDRLERFRDNDRLGSPRTFDYGRHGVFSPTTLRYVKVLADLMQLFGKLDGMRILEIGGGYGGQAFVVAQAARFASYTLVDLASCIALQRRYLQQLEVPNVSYVAAPEFKADAYDLVISNYAFSELTRSAQLVYAERGLRTAKCGYITCNWMTPRAYRSLSREELLRTVPGSRFVPAGGRLDSRASVEILVWRDPARGGGLARRHLDLSPVRGRIRGGASTPCLNPSQYRGAMTVFGKSASQAPHQPNELLLVTMASACISNCRSMISWLCSKRTCGFSPNSDLASSSSSPTNTIGTLSAGWSRCRQSR